MFETHFVGFDHFGVEHIVEFGYLMAPRGVALGYFIESLLYVGCEVEVKYIREILGQEVIDHCACIGRYQFSAVCSHSFGALLLVNIALAVKSKCDEAALSAGAVAFLHIFTLLDGGYGGCVGRGTAYAEVLHFLHQRSLGIAGRMLGVALGGSDPYRLHHIPFGYRGKKR